VACPECNAVFGRITRTPTENNGKIVFKAKSLFDPVALDKACVDLIEGAPDGMPLMERINSRKGKLALTHGAKIGLGSLKYDLMDIDN